MSGGVFFTHLLFLIPANLCSSKKYCFLRINPATDKVCSLPHLRHSVGIPLSPYADSCVTRNASASTVFKTVCQFTDIPPLFFSLLSRRCNSGERRFRAATLCKRPRRKKHRIRPHEHFLSPPAVQQPYHLQTAAAVNRRTHDPSLQSQFTRSRCAKMPHNHVATIANPRRKITSHKATTTPPRRVICRVLPVCYLNGK